MHLGVRLNRNHIAFTLRIPYLLFTGVVLSWTLLVLLRGGSTEADVVLVTSWVTWWLWILQSWN